VAVDDTATTDEDSAVTVAVLANDGDVDGDTLAVESVTQPAHGSVTNNGTDVTYTPAPDFYGTDAFDYVVSDGVLTDTATVTITVNALSACELYPIALHADTLAGVAVGASIPDAYNGSGPGNFGWLSWAGDPGVPALVRSLTPPGDSDTYVNPYNSADHVLSAGDWVYGRPGVGNSRSVRDALETLKGYDITVPVWDTATKQGNNLKYHVVGFARIRITGYRLECQNRISAVFLGYMTCGPSCANPTPVDLLYVLDVSGSMDERSAGSSSKLEAAQQAIWTLNAWVAQQGNGSRVALVTFHGEGRGSGRPPLYPTDVRIVSGFTADTAALDAAVGRLDASGSTPTAAALDEVAGWLPGAWDADHVPVVVLISDGVPTVDLELHGFQDQDVQQVGLYRTDGRFLSADEVRRRGVYYAVYRERAGEPLADTMVALEELKGALPEAAVYAVAVQARRGGIFNDDILRYVAQEGGGQYFVAQDALELVEALQWAFVDSACSAGSP
jgi:hypothetical protein